MTDALPQFVLLGTDTGKGIYRAPWNPATGEIGGIEIHSVCDRPVYFAQHPTLPVLYVNNEMSGGKAKLSSFAIREGGLKPLQQMPCDDGPCYVSCTTEHVFSANYAAGSFETWELDPAGKISPKSHTLRETGDFHPGPVADRQDKPHFHCAVISPDRRYVVVCDLGSDKLLVLPTGSPMEAFSVVKARPGSGPRHVAFHPNGKWMYCVHELDCTINCYDWNGARPVLRPGTETQLLTPGTALTGNTGCELLISPDGRFAYACTRGVDEITTYAIDAKSGALTELQRMSSGGKIPRIITFDPSRRWLVACNQGAPGVVAVFAHDPETAQLTLAHTYAAPTPMCVAWV